MGQGGSAPASSEAEFVVAGVRYELSFGDQLDLAAIRTRFAKDRAKAEAEANKVSQKLANADFIARAKEEVVEENRERLASFTAEMARLDAALARIGG